MSDSERDASVLGKRLRNGGDESRSNGSEDSRPEPKESIEEDDDDDVGPMPMPVDGVKKKRKGVY